MAGNKSLGYPNRNTIEKEEVQENEQVEVYRVH